MFLVVVRIIQSYPNSVLPLIKECVRTTLLLLQKRVIYMYYTLYARSFAMSLAMSLVMGLAIKGLVLIVILILRTKNTKY